MVPLGFNCLAKPGGGICCKVQAVSITWVARPDVEELEQELKHCSQSRGPGFWCGSNRSKPSKC